MTSPAVTASRRPSLPKSRRAKQVSSLLDRRLAAYALVATAAAAGVPAFGQSGSNAALSLPASSRSILDVPPRPNAISYSPADIPFIGSAYRFTAVPIDFNSDGVADITITASGRHSHSFGGSATFSSAQGGWSGSAMRRPLAFGDRIGQPASFEDGGFLARAVWSDRHHGSVNQLCAGAFHSVNSMYMGARFFFDNEAYFGWIGISVQCDDHKNGTSVSGKITGFAYNTVPGESIYAGQKYAKPPEESEGTEKLLPEPGTLGALSLGSVVRRP
jgi:hypothetical protein